MSQYKKYFTVSFDDGLEQDKRMVALMRRYGIRGTFNLNSGLMGQKEYIKYVDRYGVQTVDKSVKKGWFWKYADSDRIPADEIRQVYEGMELASHGAHHLNQAKLKSEQLRDEILKDREALQAYTDLPVVGHAFPKGRTSAAVEQVLKESGFLYARGIMSDKDKRQFAFPENPLNFKPTCWQIEKDFEALFDEFLAASPINGDMLFYVWGHGYEFDFPSCKGLFEIYERVFEKVAENDEIIKCTNAEAFIAHNG